MYKHPNNVYKRFQKDTASRNKDINRLVNCPLKHRQTNMSKSRAAPPTIIMSVDSCWDYARGTDGLTRRSKSVPIVLEHAAKLIDYTEGHKGCFSLINQQEQRSTAPPL